MGDTLPQDGGNNTKELMRCIHFAAIKHKDQRRKDPEKTPYVNHVIGEFVWSVLCTVMQ